MALSVAEMPTRALENEEEDYAFVEVEEADEAFCVIDWSRLDEADSEADEETLVEEFSGNLSEEEEENGAEEENEAKEQANRCVEPKAAPETQDVEEPTVEMRPREPSVEETIELPTASAADTSDPPDIEDDDDDDDPVDSPPPMRDALDAEIDFWERRRSELRHRPPRVAWHDERAGFHFRHKVLLESS